jgi:serine/threonine protein kinase
MANRKDRDSDASHSDASLGDQHTFQGQAKPRIDYLDTRSLGDQATFAGASGDDDFLDDDMEVVDLEARYKIEKTLGKGGMGEVLLATDMRLDRRVAIKRILGDAARSRTAVNRFLTEAKSIAALNHPNVVQIHDYGRDRDGPFLIMEYVETSLLERCRDGALPSDQASILRPQYEQINLRHSAIFLEPLLPNLRQTFLPNTRQFLVHHVYQSSCNEV